MLGGGAALAARAHRVVLARCSPAGFARAVAAAAMSADMRGHRARASAESSIPKRAAQPHGCGPGRQPAGTPLRPGADTLLAQAVELHQAGDILGAIAAYESALKLQPDNAGAHSNLGAALVRLGRYDAAVGHYRRALSLDPANLGFRFNTATRLLQGRRHPRAATELPGVLAADKRSADARLLLGDCYLRMGRFQDVVDLLAPWEDDYDDDCGFDYVLGSAFVETDRPSTRSASSTASSAAGTAPKHTW